jgi:hypothetical protein
VYWSVLAKYHLLGAGWPSAFAGAYAAPYQWLEYDSPVGAVLHAYEDWCLARLEPPR